MDDNDTVDLVLSLRHLEIKPLALSILNYAGPVSITDEVPNIETIRKCHTRFFCHFPFV